jgi:uroporphyrin-3 C-methyltransferase
MTEQQNQSAVVEETREAVDTTPQPENTEKKNGGNKTSLALSAIAIAIAMAAGVGLYGLNKQQATRQNEPARAGQIAALQKAAGKAKKNELEGIIKQQADQLAEANTSRRRWPNSWMKCSKKSPSFPAAMPKPGCWRRPISSSSWPGRKLWSDQDVTTAAALLKSADASLADMNDPSLIGARRAITDDIAALRRKPGGLRRHYPQGESAGEPD